MFVYVCVYVRTSVCRGPRGKEMWVCVRKIGVLYVCMYVCMYVCIYVCIYVYIIYIHTIHTYHTFVL